LLQANNININVLASKFRNELKVSEISLEDVDFQLVVYEGEENLNLQFILDYVIASDTAVKVKEPFYYPVTINSLVSG